MKMKNKKKEYINWCIVCLIKIYAIPILLLAIGVLFSNFNFLVAGGVICCAIALHIFLN